MDELVIERHCIGGERHVNACLSSLDDDVTDVFVQEGLPLPGIHDAFDTALCHLSHPPNEKVLVQASDLVSNVIHRAECAAVIARARRRDFDVEGIDRLGFFPLIPCSHPSGYSVRMIHQLV